MFHYSARPSETIGFGFTDRLGGITPGPMGALNLGRSDVDDPQNVITNFERVRTRIGVPHLVTVAQRHTATVSKIDAPQLADWHPSQVVGNSVAGQPRLPIADAMITTTPGVALAIRVADCLPVLLYDPTVPVVGAVHAGRVGLAAGILAAAVTQLRAAGATCLTAVIGPHICAQCYELPGELIAPFAQDVPAAAATTSWGTPALDLAAVAQAQLNQLDCAVLPRPVDELDWCTRTNKNLHSHRRDGAAAGRQCGLIWINRR